MKGLKVALRIVTRHYEDWTANQAAIMPLQVQRITDPADFEAFADIHSAAFVGSGITSLLAPNPLPADYRQNNINKHVKSWSEEPDVVYLKVIDTDLNGKMIACAKWRVNTKERTPEEAEKAYPKLDEKEQKNQALVDFCAFLARVRKQYMGTKPFYCKMATELPRRPTLISRSLASPCNAPRPSPQRRRCYACRMGYPGSGYRATALFPGVVAHG